MVTKKCGSVTTVMWGVLNIRVLRVKNMKITKNHKNSKHKSKSTVEPKGRGLFPIRFVVIALIAVLLSGYLVYMNVQNKKTYFEANDVDIDNMSAEEVAINLVTAGRKLPMSDDPELNAMRAVDQTVRQAIENKKTDAEIERQAEIEAVRAARDTMVSVSNANGAAYPARSSIPTIKERQLEAHEAAYNAIDTIRTFFTYGVDENGKAVVTPNKICEKAEFGVLPKCRYVSINYNRVYTSNGSSKLCQVDEKNYYPVGTGVVSRVVDKSVSGEREWYGDDMCRVCTRIAAYAGNTKSADFVETECSKIPSNMVIRPAFQGGSNYCRLYKVDGVDKYRLKPVLGDEGRYDSVLFPENGQSIIVYSSEGDNPAMELLCSGGVMQQVQ